MVDSMGMLGQTFGEEKTVQALRNKATRKPVVMADEKPETEAASNLIRIVCESLEIAATSFDPETIISRLQVARTKLGELEELASHFESVTLDGTEFLTQVLRTYEREVKHVELDKLAATIEVGRTLESSGQLDGAIEAYEQLVAMRVSAALPYKRLAVNYRKQQRRKEELAVLRTAVEVVPRDDETNHKWLSLRLEKLESERGK